MSAEEEDGVKVSLARVETKLDVVIGQHGEQLRDHEARIRVQEAKKTVSPMGLLAAVAGGVGAYISVIEVFDRLYK